MEVSPFAIVYFGTKIFVRCAEVSVVYYLLLLLSIYLSLDINTIAKIKSS